MQRNIWSAHDKMVCKLCPKQLKFNPSVRSFMWVGEKNHSIKNFKSKSVIIIIVFVYIFLCRVSASIKSTVIYLKMILFHSNHISLSSILLLALVEQGYWLKRFVQIFFGKSSIWSLQIKMFQGEFCTLIANMHTQNFILDAYKIIPGIWVNSD